MATKATLKRYSGLQFVEFYPKTTHDQIIASGTPSNTTFLRGDGVWATPAVSGTGDVTGPASSVDNRIAVFNGTTGKIIKDSGTLISGLALASHIHDDRYYTETEIDAKIDFAIRLQIYPQTKNTSGSTIPKGAVVQFAGTQGDFSLIKQAVASEINANPSLLMGLAREAILNDAFGDVVWFGNVLEVATGSLTIGQILWFDTTTGGLTATEPATNKIQLAAVQKASSTPEAINGILLVRIKYVSRDIDEVDGLQNALDGKLNTSGGTLTGALTIDRPMQDGTNAYTSPHLVLSSTNTTDTTGFVGMVFDTSTSANYGWSYGAQRTSDGNGDLIWRNHDISTAGVERMRLLDNGNLGIGTTSPAARLDVAGGINVQGNILLTGTATTTNQGRMIDFTGFDKEGTTDFSDRAYIQHTVNTGGHAGSVLEISSQNDTNDGIAFTTNASSQIRHNGHIMWDANNDGAGSGLDADLLDGIDSTGFMRAGLTLTNPNTILNGGNRYDPNANNPTNTYYSILTYGNGGNVTGQIATHFQTGASYVRAFNTSFSTWQRLFADDYHPNADTLTTARTLTIGSTGKTFNGSVDVSWSLTDLGLGNVNNTSDANKPVSTAQQTALDLKLNTSARGAANGVASLDANSKIPVAQLPDSVFDSLYFNGGGVPGDSEFPLSYLSAYSIRDAKQTNRSPLGYYYVALSGGTFTFTDVWVTFGDPQPPVTSFPVFGRVFQQTLTLTQGSAVVPYTFASSSDIGLSVLGTGFPTGTTIVSFTSTTITLSNPATVNGNQSFQFGYYVTISTPSLEEGVDSGSYPTSVTLEIADWFVITKLTGEGTISDPYEVTWGFVNNTYELATDVVHGITQLSNITSVSSSTTGSQVITQGVLGGLIGTAANTIAAGNHTHSAADISSGTLSVERGGTGAATHTSGNVLIGAGTNAVTTLSRSGIDSRTAFPTTYANITGTVPTWNQSTTGNAATATTAQSVVRTVTGTTSAELVRGNMADNDQFRILVGGTASNAGFAEIATADDGTEPIHVRQYTGVFTTLVRTATLLDGSGNTSLPGSLTVGGNISLTGASSLSTSTGALTLSTAAGNGNIILSPNGTGVITSTARLGLGTTSPGSVIHVKNATPEIKLEAGSTTDSGTMRYNTTTKSIEFIFV
jgi:hypothetical protein